MPDARKLRVVKIRNANLDVRSGLVALCLLLCAPAGQGANPPVDLTKPLPSLTLPDGRVFQQATFATFKVEGVLIRHRGGSAYVVYEALPPEVRIEAEKKRPGGPRTFSGDVAKEAVTYKGQVFVQTRGRGSYKFGGIAVRAFPIEALQQWEFNSRPVRLPRAIAETKTDGDGRFTLRVPNGEPVFIFVQADRLAAGEREQSEWRLRADAIKNKDELYLNGDNVAAWAWTKVEIEPTP